MTTSTTSSSSKLAPLLLPGQPLSVNTLTPSALPQLGSGVYSRSNYLLSSLVGFEQRLQDTLSVQGVDHRFVVPKPDSIVIGRVTRVTPRQTHISILTVNGQPCGSSSSSFICHTGLGNHAAGEGEGTDFQGIIRCQDVRSTEKDLIKLADCFRPGDIVRASVISLGDARSYYLSTASNHLGVIYATSSSSSSSSSLPTSTGPGWKPFGNPMVPINWQEMMDPVTGIKEKRKCAKPDTV